MGYQKLLKSQYIFMSAYKKPCSSLAKWYKIQIQNWLEEKASNKSSI